MEPRHERRALIERLAEHDESHQREERGRVSRTAAQ
jgi:hypothetical protein